MIWGDWMGYRIRYQPTEKNRKKNLGFRSMLTVLCFFLFLVLVFSLWPDGKDAVKKGLDFLRPTVMISVMNEIAEIFQNGRNLVSEVETIFSNIIQGETLAAG